MTAHMRSLERNYQDVLAEMVNFQRNMAQQDGLMQNLIQYFLQVENGEFHPYSFCLEVSILLSRHAP
jgi:osomolarity two-component system response regulator SKN7